ncbi:MAG: divergent polysaccharide deacetylase family protein [Pseudomonadota bacterium]
MFWGFFSGVIWGGIVSGAVVFVALLAMAPPVEEPISVNPTPAAQTTPDEKDAPVRQDEAGDLQPPEGDAPVRQDEADDPQPPEGTALPAVAQVLAPLPQPEVEDEVALAVPQQPEPSAPLPSAAEEQATPQPAEPEIIFTPVEEEPVPQVSAETVAPTSDDALGAEVEVTPALIRHAVPFEGAGGRPLMSIVLRHEGGAAAQVGALASVGIPVTLAIEADAPDAAAVAEAYRSAGHEIIVAVRAPLGSLAEAVGAVEQAASVLNETSSVDPESIDALTQSGHGFVGFGAGTDSLAAARAAGLQAKDVFRDIDANGQTAVVIRRFLDQAAFLADQEGGVIILGRVRPETISALRIWEQQSRAQEVAVAPLSALLLAQ